MFSSTLRQSLATAAASAVVVASVSRSPVYADERKPAKLSIYDDPEPEVVLIEAPTKLEEHFAVAQKYADETVAEGKSHLNNIQQRWNQFENDVDAVVDQTIAKDEELWPNVLFVGVAGLAGTIIARRRNFVLRFLTSAALAAGTSYYLFPKTTHNVCFQLEKLESKYPPLQSAHKSVKDTVCDLRQQVDATVAQLKGTVQQNTDKLREQIQQNADALKNQAAGFEREVKQQVSVKKEEAVEKKEEVKDNFDNIKKNVESMYSTRSNPGVEETLKKN
ncbi:apolipo protein O-domain-containing protein [Radiomyces spectabilis]|uniref:apolipo protein O-domain-containing protein n=1 Tax=Radiomyces spectabilis TaxID=64574 RepID=UPI00221FEF77|nr:apolipo protein O-domain-containing protein [Radiomyces spectabilis]KAI8376122.1 apolipo protein O-domain-containing protein [Radiomyces spectabilis]